MLTRPPYHKYKIMANKKTEMIKVEVPDEALSDSRFINTPFSFTKYDGSFALGQQDLLFKVSEHLQSTMQAYFEQRKVDGDKRGYSLFLLDENNLAMNVPDIHVKFKELGIKSGNYKDARVSLKKIVNTLVRIDDSRGRTYQHVFSSVTFPQRVNNDNNIINEETLGDEVILAIDPKIAKFAFDMRQGYIKHIAAIAEYASKPSTPKLYIYLKRLLDINRCKRHNLTAAQAKVYGTKYSYVVKVPFTELKDFMGFYERNEQGEIIKIKYPRFSHFKTKVLDATKDDMIRMSNENNIEIMFDYVPIYKYDRKRGDPDEIEFYIMRTRLGEAKLNGKTNAVKNIENKTAVPPVEADLFAHVNIETLIKPEIEKEKGLDKWQQLILEYDGPAKQLLETAEFRGMFNGSLCYSLPEGRVFDDADFKEINKIAKTILGITNKFQPGIVKK